MGLDWAKEFEGVLGLEDGGLVLICERCSSIVRLLTRSLSKSEERILSSSPGLKENGN